MILGSLYESLGLSNEALKNLEPNDNLFLVGPYWLLRLWLNKMFELSLDVEKPNDTDEPINNKRVEGTRLAQITMDDKNRSDQDAFLNYFLMFIKHHNVTPTRAPFINRTHGPEWFSKKFHATGEKEA